jgi:hypothetical protein
MLTLLTGYSQGKVTVYIRIIISFIKCENYLLTRALPSQMLQTCSSSAG